MIQLQGLVNETLSRLTYDISNAQGILTNQVGQSAPLFFNTNSQDFTTNTFQCYDIALTNGLNTIVVHAVDLAGNSSSTNVSFTLDYSGATPPHLSTSWPATGTSISGTNFTLQAQLDDDTATVTAQIVDNNGDTTIVQGLVERSGLVWALNLPLAAGTNILTITATNAAGLSVTTNLTFVQSPTLITMNPLSQLNQASVSVTGTMSDPTCSLTINGQPAYPTDTNGDWQATNVLVSPTGTAIFNAEIFNSNSVQVGSQQFTQVQPPMVVLESDSGSDTQYQAPSAQGLLRFYQFNFTYPPSPTTYFLANSTSWSYLSGGTANFAEDATYGWLYYNYQYGGPGPTSGIDTNSSLPIPAGVGSYSAPWEEASYTTANAPGNTIGNNFYNNHVQLMIAPSGQAPIGQKVLYLVQAQMSGEAGSPSPPINAIQIQAQTLTAVTNDEEPVWGQVSISASAGAPLTITPSGASGNVGINEQAATLSLTAVSNSAVQINGTTNWGTVEQQSNYVIIQANLDTTSPQFLAWSATNILWSGGTPVSGNPMQREISTAISTNTVVTASLGTVTNSLEVWVIWAALTIKVSGTIDTNDDAEILVNGNWPTPTVNNFMLRGGSGLGGGNGLGTIDCLSNTNLNYAFTVGRMEAKAALQPTGIGHILNHGWNLKRTTIGIGWDNGGESSSSAPPPGENDTSPPQSESLTPINDDVFDLDTPGCSDVLPGTNIDHTAEVYDNFYEYLAVKLGNENRTCSTTNTWSYEARVDIDNLTNKVQLNSLSTSLIELPVNSYYQER
jgi:hypothetical protein